MKKKNKLAFYIIGSALIWGATIIGCSYKLKGTECFNEITLILSAAAGIHLILIWGSMVTQFKTRSIEKGPEDKDDKI